MQDEGKPLSRGQRVQHNQQGDAHRVGKHCLVLGIAKRASRAAGRRWLPACGLRVCPSRLACFPQGADRFLAPVPARAEHVQRDPRADGRQPAAQIRHVGRVRAAEPQPGVLDRVIGIRR